MLKYIGAMVRKSIRVVLVAENDLIEVASDPGAEEPRRSSPRGAWGGAERFWEAARGTGETLDSETRNLKIAPWNRPDRLRPPLG